MTIANLSGNDLIAASMIQVRASREIRQNHVVLIPEGTPGAIVRAAGTNPTLYTVTFWPEGPNGVKITVPFLHESDFIVLSPSIGKLTVPTD